MKAKKRKAHWYKQYVGECPVCGRDQSYRIRVYGRKPKDLSRCYVQIPCTETYDYCDV